MEFEAWKKAIFADIEKIGFNKTYRKYGLASRSLRLLVQAREKGDAMAGLQSWKRKGVTLKASDLK